MATSTLVFTKVQWHYHWCIKDGYYLVGTSEPLVALVHYRWLLVIVDTPPHLLLPLLILILSLHVFSVHTCEHADILLMELSVFMLLIYSVQPMYLCIHVN